MGFSTKQVQALRRQPSHRFIRTREAHGRELSYLEGWYAISEANRIFGFDGWNRETVEAKCVLARESRGSFLAVYIARVRVTVQAGGAAIIREGHGSGEGHGTSPGEVHDIALKAAETDATKRALATFGKPFGLELYRNGGRGLPVHQHEQGNHGQEPLRQPVSMTTRQPIAAPETPSLVPGARVVAGHPGHPIGAADDQVVAEPRVGLPPDDTTPIPRPSRYYGRRQDPVTRDRAQARRDLRPPAATSMIVPAAPGLVPAPIDKSLLTLAEPRRLRDKAHLKFVAAQACLICGRQPSDPHHLRFAQPRAIGLKVSDEFTVPLCRGHHRQLHQVGNEVTWWEKFNLRPLEVAKALWEETHPRSAAALLQPTKKGAACQSPDEAGQTVLINHKAAEAAAKVPEEP